MLESRQPDDVHSSGTLVLEHGQYSPSHQHERGHLAYPATGILSVTTSEGTWVAPSNRAAWTPGGFQHQHRAYGRTDMRVLFLPPTIGDALPRRPAVLVVSSLAREVFLALTGPAWRQAGIRRHLQHVLVDELAIVPERPLRLPRPADDRLRAVADLLHADPADSSTLPELGRAVGTSARTLSRLFHEELGMSFRHWRTQLRLHHSLLLLANDRSITATAHACGWSNPSSFIDAFTAVLGQTPGQYQDQRTRTPERP
ncbi:AraC family transcriptional regulator [Actinoallomurus acaciae]|uniref:Helix-turn-helix domain-containing protein n=1 Tax=Actinoallomurus acaciae TaxID=502577 RepID=A0ABV5YD25_9ACTN